MAVLNILYRFISKIKYYKLKLKSEFRPQIMLLLPYDIQYRKFENIHFDVC